MKKGIQIILICLIIAGIVVIATKGFNVGVKYSENTQININIGKEFDVEDVRTITNEVFKGESVMIQQVELYKDMLQVTVKNASDEQIEQLNTKINEKYELDNTVADDVIIMKNANTKLKSLVEPYLVPLSITLAVILVYVLIRFRKLGIWKVLYTTLITIIGAQAVLFSLYAVTRLPINRITQIASIMLYLITTFIIMNKFQKENQKLKETEENKEIKTDRV